MKKSMAEVKAKNADGVEQVVATVEFVEAATLEELVEEFGSEKAVVEFALRQAKQDAMNKARADWANGGKKAAKEAKINELAERVKNGDITAIDEIRKLVLQK